MDKAEIKKQLIDIMSVLYWDEFSGIDTDSLNDAADNIIELFDKLKQDGQDRGVGIIKEDH
jgi:hypothetical protein